MPSQNKPFFLSLARMLRAGWSKNAQQLSEPCLVIKA
jgi:hypothetical protein